MVETPMVQVIIETPDSAPHIARLFAEDVHSGPLARALQPYSVQIPARFRELLRQNGKGAFVAEHLRGDQFFILTESSLYRDDTGLWWEGAEELTEAQSHI